ncbi:MAG: beta-ketoacyl synthase N-terminal-like domain-containing protein, partial [bacterium]
MGSVLETAIAIVGMAGRFPLAQDLEELWENLLQGHECVRFFRPDELRAAGVSEETLSDERYVPARSVLEGSDLFDAEFFGFSPREAEVTDPQHRLFLESAWHALESGGVDPSRFPGRIGVFASASLNTYLFDGQAQAQAMRSVGRYRALLGNDKDYLPTWVSYKLGLSGPSVAVQSACSSSLVAVHLACQSLLTGECDLALAGAASVQRDQLSGYRYEEGGILSPDGYCRAFDADAAGTVGGNGVGVVLLRRLSDALTGRDPIRAVIRGSAVNNDGSAKVGYTAPSVEGQARAIAEALAVAELSPEQIGYVEAHGTGTRLGDPVEVAALSEVFRAEGVDVQPGACLLGSIKTNMGHLDTAAGVAGLIKAVLALESG